MSAQFIDFSVNFFMTQVSFFISLIQPINASKYSNSIKSCAETYSQQSKYLSAEGVWVISLPRMQNGLRNNDSRTVGYWIQQKLKK